MAGRVITLYIRDTGINLLVMKGRRVEKWASLPLEPGLISRGQILDEARVAAKVKELFKREGVGPGKVIVGVSGVNSVYRIISLPALPDAILPEAVRREAERAIPEPLHQVYLSYQSIPAPKGETRIFLCAFPRNVTDALIRTLRQAGIKPYIMDLAPLALCRIPDEPRAIIVNARQDHVGIMVIADRIPQVIRRLSLPGEAESLSERLPIISEEFSRTVAFYNSSHEEKPLNSTVPVFVCGDLAGAAESWQSLVGELGCAVSPLLPAVEYPEGFSPNEFSVNIGLAFKKLRPEKGKANFSLVNFNALPDIYRPKQMALGRVLVPTASVLGVGLIVFMGILVQGGAAHVAALRSELAPVEMLVAQYRSDTAVLSEQVWAKEARIGEMKAARNIFETTFAALGKAREDIAGDLSRIAGLLPPGVVLTEVDHLGDRVTLSGTAPTAFHAFEYARALRDSARFVFVAVPLITRIEGGIRFEFSIINREMN
jgi:type IV pilus assembly protein PilM